MNKPAQSPRPPTPPARVEAPGGATRVLLHVCCAVCAAPILEALLHSGIQPTAYFYNPNMDSLEEYNRRKEEHLRYLRARSIPHADADYDPDRWAEAVRGLEHEHERGARCDVCFEMRLTCAARCAEHLHIPLLATTLGISRWKDLDQVNRAGALAVAHTPSVAFWPQNWRKLGGSQRMAEIAREEAFYRQDYCGCAYSRRSP